MTLEQKYIDQAKEIVGKWGYEEPYWWRPIAEALQRTAIESAHTFTYDSTPKETVKIDYDELKKMMLNGFKKEFLEKLPQYIENADDPDWVEEQVRDLIEDLLQK